MADTSLIFNLIARDKTGKTFKKMQGAAMSTGKTIATALGPAVAPVLATATAGAIGLAGALAGAGAAAGVFGAVFATTFTEVKEAAAKTDDLREKIRLLDQQARMSTGGDREAFLKKSAKATLELQARLKLLDPATRNAAYAVMQLKSDWLDFVDANKPQTLGLMTRGMTVLGAIIPKLQPLFDIGSAAASRFVGWLEKAAKGGGIDRFIAWLTSQAGPAFQNLGTIGKNFGIIIGDAIGGLADKGQGMLDWLAEASTRWAEASKSAEGGGIQKFVDYVDKHGPAVKQLLINMAAAMKTLAQASAPLAPISLAIAGALAGIIGALPPGVLTTLVAGWVAYSVALKAYHGYTMIVMAATKIWTGIQWLLNAAMAMNPIGLVVIAIAALIAIIVLIATKTTWFQDLWNWLWGKIGDPVKAVWAWIKDNWPLLLVILSGPVGWIAAFVIKNWDKIKSATSAVKDWIVDKFTAWVNYIRSIPGRMKSAAASMFNPIKNAFKGALNYMIGKWNNFSLTLGGGSVMGMGIPSVTLRTPNIPYMESGGTVRKGGAAVVADRNGQGGEVVSLPRGAQVTPLRGGAGSQQIEMVILPGADKWVVELIRRFVKFKGGNVQIAFGGNKK